MAGTNPVSSSAGTTPPAQPIPPSDTTTQNRSNAVYQNTVPGNQPPITPNNNLVGRVDLSTTPDAARMTSARSRLYSA